VPALALVEDVLLMHCDSMFYRQYGASVEAVNQSIAAVLESADLPAWDSLMDVYFDRGAFSDHANGEERARTTLHTFGGKLIVHGHTPIPYLTGQEAITVTRPAVYAGGLCMDIDGGIYMGGPGFLVHLDQSRTPSTITKSG
jgi:hypothetical protein